MGVESRKPPLPAPTESSVLQTSGGSGEEADIATDISRRTDKTSYSIPEDGSPIVIPTKNRRDRRDRDRETTLTRTTNKSQTSLLIEYFGGGKSPNVHSRPSVRVKVTPSAARKIKDTNEHVQVTTSKGRKASHTQRISLEPQTITERQVSGSGDDKSISSYTSAAEESSLAHRYPPVEIEVMHGDDGSDLSRSSLGREEMAREERYVQVNPSEISSMPPDSMLDEKAGVVTPRHDRSRSVSKDAVNTTDNTLKTPSRRRSRSLSKERLAHKAMEKLAGRSQEVSGGKHKRSSKTRSRSASNEQSVESHRSGRRRSSKSYKEEEAPSGAESSLLTSQMSPRRQSGDQYSFRSGTSKSSINANPKLLETVENAIRRLIMPELETLKQEQKLQQGRSKFDRESIASESSASRGELSRKLSKHASAPDVSGKPKVFLNRDEHNTGTLLSGDSVKGRKESRRKHKESDSTSDRRSEREMSEETVIRDGGKASRKKSKDGHRLGDTVAGGLAGGVLTAAALNHHNRSKDHDLHHYDSKSSIDRKERRRRRSSKSHSRSASIAESTEDAFTKHDVPPMPMQSDIHSSEITRDSILSERTEAPSSASEELRVAEIRHVSRGSPREILSPASRTPTSRSPLGIQRSLGTHHGNLSQGDLHDHSPHSDRSFQDDEHHSKVAEVGTLAAATSAGANQRDEYGGVDYRYQHESRGLSPIQSVSSRQESEANRDSFAHKRSTGSLSSLKQHRSKRSAASLNSLGSPVSVDMRRSNRPKGINYEPSADVLDQHGLRESQYTEGDVSDRDPAMDEWLEQEHEKNDRYRDSIDESSYRDSNRDSTVGYKHMTDDSLDAPYLDKATAAQELQGGNGGRNPDFVHTPMAVESAVASLIDTSTISMRSKQGEKYHTGSQEGEVGHERGLSQQNLEQLPDVQKTDGYDQLSSKGSPRQSIARSYDEPDEAVPMVASGLPIADDPIPEIGHGLNSDSDISTNPSIIQGPIGGFQNNNLDHWPNKPTPPQAKGEFMSRSKDSSAHESLKAAAAGFLTAAATASRDQSPQKPTVTRDLPSREPQSQQDYQQGINHDFGQNRDSYMTNQSIPSPPKDEGYISGPQPRSPEISFNNAKAFNDDGFDGNMSIDNDDVFTGPSHTKHMSTNSHGLAHGMGSPLYDGATGGGIDRIHSKDIVALMDHVCTKGENC